MALVANRVFDMISLKVPSSAACAIRSPPLVFAKPGIFPAARRHVGPRLLTAQAMHLAAALPALSFACEFGEFVRLKNDITEVWKTRTD